MRLSFCFLSNRKVTFENLINNFHFEADVHVQSWTKNILLNPPISPHTYAPYWNIKYKEYNSFPVADMFWMRQDSIDMAGHADLIYIGDDDMEFKDKSSEAINECCAYMEENIDCGAIYLGGNFGGEGDSHGNEIYIANKGALGTNRGILVRNRPVVMDNCFHALGAMFDCAVGFTCLIQGYYIARRLHVPIEHHTKTMLEYGHPNLFYDLKYINTYGIRAKMMEVIGGEWTDRQAWPKNIFSIYRQAAMVAGRELVYDIDGNIM
jgi:hypothetical protein